MSTHFHQLGLLPTNSPAYIKTLFSINKNDLQLIYTIKIHSGQFLTNRTDTGILCGGYVSIMFENHMSSWYGKEHRPNTVGMKGWTKQVVVVLGDDSVFKTTTTTQLPGLYSVV